jgi:hypothetical protein
MVNIATALATLEPELEDVLRILGARRMHVLLEVGLPRSMPYFFASLKLVITLAFVGSTVSEMNAANEGIGYLLVSAGLAMKMPLVFAGLGAPGRREIVRLKGARKLDPCILPASGHDQKHHLEMREATGSGNCETPPGIADSRTVSSRVAIPQLSFPRLVRGFFLLKGYAAREQPLELLSGSRRRVEKTLPEIAARVAQQVPLLMRLNTFRDDP